MEVKHLLPTSALPQSLGVVIVVCRSISYYLLM